MGESADRYVIDWDATLRRSGMKRDVEVLYEPPPKKEADEMWARAAGARVEPAFIHGQWWITAPVDLKGVKRHPECSQVLWAVEGSVKEMDAQGLFTTLPEPQHWKQENQCPIT